ncbi:MAG: 2-amino-4-hydroxy-6-hydroxymethyldihydropteridine diphosphokinase [Chitinivibrionales bacterium]
MNTAVIGVGSNINAPKNIALAKEALSREQRLDKESAFITTSPIGFSDQPDFMNGAFLVSTELSIDEFKDYLKGLEDRLGRVRTGNKFGPRAIDLDVVAWNGKIVNKDFYERDFVRNAVMEVLPEIKAH